MLSRNSFVCLLISALALVSCLPKNSTSTEIKGAISKKENKLLPWQSDVYEVLDLASSWNLHDSK